MSLSFEVLRPTGVDLIQKKIFAARPSSLDGKTVGLVWNKKPDADILLQEIGKLIEERFKDVKVKQVGITDCCIQLPPGELEGIAAMIDVGVFAAGD